MAMAADQMPAGDGGHREWIGRIEALKADGGINAGDEASVIRHIAEQREALDQTLARIMPEYQRRLTADGRESAERWLGDTARSLGEAQGRESRRLVDSLDASQSP